MTASSANATLATVATTVNSIIAVTSIIAAAIQMPQQGGEGHVGVCLNELDAVREPELLRTAEVLAE